MNEDFQGFFASLNAKQVRFLVIGGVAYNFYAPPRATKDIDVWVEPAPGNLARLKDAIAAFGFPTDDLDLAELERTAKVLMLGRVPNRIDVLTRPTGVDWDGAWSRRRPSRYGTAEIHFIDRADLIAAKKAAGRPRDLADVATLEAIARRDA